MISTKFLVKTIWRVSLVFLIIVLTLIPINFTTIISIFVKSYRPDAIILIISKFVGNIKFSLETLLTYIWYLCIAKLLLLVAMNQRNLKYKNICK